jgi:hypothetical protein
MHYGKAVEEVWEWREALAKELEKVPDEKRGEYLNKKADDICKKYGLKCRTAERERTNARRAA